MNLCHPILRLRARWDLRRPPRPLRRGDRVDCCLRAIADAGPLTRHQREDFIARWAITGDVHDRAHVAQAVYKRLGAYVPPLPRRSRP